MTSATTMATANIQPVRSAHLQKLFDDFSEEVGQASRLCNAGIGCNGKAKAGPVLVSGNEGIEQQWQPVPSKVPQHLCIPACNKAQQVGKSTCGITGWWT